METFEWQMADMITHELRRYDQPRMPEVGMIIRLLTTFPDLATDNIIFHAACMRDGWLPVVQFMASKGASINGGTVVQVGYDNGRVVPHENQVTPIMAAANNGCPEIMRFLVGSANRASPDLLGGHSTQPDNVVRVLHD